MLKRNAEGEPIGFVEDDYDCGLDKEFYAENPDLLEGDYDIPEDMY